MIWIIFDEYLDSLILKFKHVLRILKMRANLFFYKSSRLNFENDKNSMMMVKFVLLFSSRNFENKNLVD